MATSNLSQHSTRSVARPPALTLPARLQNRDSTDCDGVGTFTCPTGTCYTGIENGYIGCCSVSSCAARTTCIPFTAGVTQYCNPNTGGCVVCSESTAPACVTISNILEDQFIMYCGSNEQIETMSYVNLVTTGSMANPPSVGIVTPAAYPSGYSYISFISESIGTVTPAAYPSGDPYISFISESIRSTSALPASSVSSSSSSSSLHSASTLPTPSTLSTTTLSKSSTTSGRSSPTTRPPPSISITPTSNNAVLAVGAIVGIVIGVVVFVLLFCLVVVYCIRPLRAYRNRKRPTTHTPRGTLGGATLPGETPHTDGTWKPDSSGRGTNSPALEQMSMLRSNPDPSVPWSPNSVGLSIPIVGSDSQELDSTAMQNPELDGRALTPPLGVVASYRGDITPTIRHVLEARQEANVQARLLSGQQGGSGLLPLTRTPGKRESAVVSELGSATQAGNGQPSPVTPGSGTNEDLRPGTGTMTRASPLIGKSVNASTGFGASLGGSFSPATPATRMSATGSWKGYMSPEEALAGGWRDDGEVYE